METVRKLNQIGRIARAGQFGVDDYLRAVTSDPLTDWFTEVLREKNHELESERQRADRLAEALQAWSTAKHAGLPDYSADAADRQLINVLEAMGILKP